MERLLPNSVEAWHSPSFDWFLGGSIGSKENNHDTSTWGRKDIYLHTIFLHIWPSTCIKITWMSFLKSANSSLPLRDFHSESLGEGPGKIEGQGILTHIMSWQYFEIHGSRRMNPPWWHFQLRKMASLKEIIWPQKMSQLQPSNFWLQIKL